VPFLFRPVDARGRHRAIQGAAAHPAIGASPAGGTRRFERHIASKLATGRPKGAGSLNTSHSRVGPVLGLGPMSFHLAVERQSSELRRAASIAGKPVKDACSGWGRHLRGNTDPEPFEAFCYWVA
jgi:hypothetical protein